MLTLYAELYWVCLSHFSNAVNKCVHICVTVNIIMFSASESGLPAKFPLHADAAAKAELFRERYTILHQVIVSPS